MKANKLLKTLAASAMSLALLAGVTVMPAMAAEPSDGVATGNTFNTTSILRVPDNVATPAVTLTFTVDEGNGGGVRDGVPVYAGEEGGLTVTESVSYGVGNPGTVVDNQNYYEVSQDVVLTANVGEFSHAGIYQYTVTVKNEPIVTGVVVDGVKTVYVYVVEGENGLAVQNIAMVNAENVKQDNFVSTYLASDAQYGNLLVTKTVEGAFGDKTKKFEFTVSVPTNLYYEYGTVGEDGKFTPATGDGMSGLTQAMNTFYLADGEAVMIYGLVNGTNYTIDETDYTAQGYTTDVVGVVDGQQATITDGADVTAAYTNTNAGSSTPTGVILNVAPYALMVVIAVAGVAVFMRKRVED